MPYKCMYFAVLFKNKCCLKLQIVSLWFCRLFLLFQIKHMAVLYHTTDVRQYKLWMISYQWRPTWFNPARRGAWMSDSSKTRVAPFDIALINANKSMNKDFLCNICFVHVVLIWLVIVNLKWKHSTNKYNTEISILYFISICVSIEVNHAGVYMKYSMLAYLSYS